MKFDILKNFMDEMAEHRTPGNAIQVYLEGKPVFTYAAGYASLETKTPLTGEEMYSIYSCSKITTVTAGMQLLERGKILLSDPLSEYIPEFKEMYIKGEDGRLTKAKNPITLENLFTMTAGFTYDFNTPAFQKACELTHGKMDTLTTIRCLAEDPLSFEPGTRWQYSLCHDVLAAVISVVSGQKFRDYVQDNIFDPLEMKDTVYHHTDETLARTASQYRFAAEGEETRDIVEAQKCGRTEKGIFLNVGKGVSHILGEEYDSGGAGIITTVPDYAKLTAALANYGTGVNGERILSQYAVDLMRTNRLKGEQWNNFNWPQLRGCGYGLGVRTQLHPESSDAITSFGEFGWGGAAGATAIIDPSINLGVFYAQHLLNPGEEYYQPRLRNAVYACL